MIVGQTRLKVTVGKIWCEKFKNVTEKNGCVGATHQTRESVREVIY